MAYFTDKKQGVSFTELNEPVAKNFEKTASPGNRSRRGAMHSEKAAKSRKQFRPRA